MSSSKGSGINPEHNHVAEDKNLPTAGEIITGLLFALSGTPYLSILHIGCNSADRSKELQRQAKRHYFGYCPDEKTLETLAGDTFRFKKEEESPRVKFSVSSSYKATGKAKLLCLIYLNSMSALALGNETAVRNLIIDLIRAAKKVIIHVILADSLNSTSVISRDHVWDNAKLSERTRAGTDVLFFPLSFFADIARENNRRYVGVTLGEKFSYDGISFDTHYLVFE